MTIYEFNRNFRRKILCLLLQPKWSMIYGTSVILPEYFELDEEIEFAELLLKYIETYDRPPTDPEDIITEMSEEHVDFVYEIFDMSDEYSSMDLEFTSDMVVAFAREQAVKSAVLDGVDDIQKGDLNKLVDRIDKAVNVGKNLMVPGVDVFRDTETWLYTLWQDNVRTGWTHVDRVLEGGIGAGELGVIMAPTNRGKSMALVNIGYGAASIGSAKNVVHFTREMKAAKVANRYAARTVFRFPNQHGNLEQYEQELIEAGKRLVPGKIHIIDAKGMPIRDMKVHIDRLEAEGFDVGVIIDDYPDLMPSSQRYTEKRHELSLNFRELVELGERYSCPVWAATQSTRSSLTKEIVTLSDVAEDIGKVQIADVVIALCQTDAEYDMNQMRLFMPKVRDNTRNHMFDAKFYGEQQAIITTGKSKKREEKDA